MSTWRNTPPWSPGQSEFILQCLMASEMLYVKHFHNLIHDNYKHQYKLKLATNYQAYKNN